MGTKKDSMEKESLFVYFANPLTVGAEHRISEEIRRTPTLDIEYHTPSILSSLF